MCTVALRWAPGTPIRVLALRDELVGRDFDDPGRWWPDLPDAVGGRDRVAGGTWCASDVATGVTALVLNRPERRTAGVGAPSRGVLPLAGLQHGDAWADVVQTAGMASFSLVLAGPESLLHWTFDGSALHRADLGEGTHVVTSGGAEDGKAERHLPAFTASDPAEWPTLLEAPVDDPRALVVRHGREGKVFATVFAQLLTAVPGRLDLVSTRTAPDGPWTSTSWTATSGR